MGKILVTGGAGYIGAITVHYMLENGFQPSDIIVFDDLVYGQEAHLPRGVFFFKGDLKKREEILEVFKKYPVCGVIHFAASAYVGESMNAPGKYFENNILGGLNLLEAMRENYCPYIVFSSTCATYGIPERVPISEQEKLKPINPYGESKLFFERILFWYDQIHDFRFLSLRYFNAAGADFGIGETHDPETHLIPLAIQSVLSQRKFMQIYGDDYETPDGTGIRDYIHVTDLADAHVRSLKYLQAGGESEVINLGTGRGASVMEVIESIRAISGKLVPYKIAPRREGDPEILVAENKKAFKILGWKPKKSLNEIIQSAWDWHSKYPN